MSRLPWLLAALTGVCAGCEAQSKKVTPVREVTVASDIVAVLFVPGSTNFLVLDATRASLFGADADGTLATSSPQRNAYGNAYSSAASATSRQAFALCMCEHGVDFVDPDSLAQLPAGEPFSGALVYLEIPDSKSYMTFLPDKTLARIDAESHQTEWRTETRYNPVDCVHAASTTWVALGEYGIGASGRVQLYRISDGTPAPFHIDHIRSIRGIAFSHDESLIATTGTEGNLQVHEVATGKRVWSVKNDVDGAFAVAFHPNDDYIAVGCMRGIKIWSLASQKLIGAWNGHTWFVDCLSFSPDGSYLLSGSADRTAALWRTADVIGAKRYVSY